MPRAAQTIWQYYYYNLLRWPREKSVQSKGQAYNRRTELTCAYENHNEYLPADRGDDSDGGACRPSGGTKKVPFKGTLQGHDVDSGFNGATVVVTTTGTGIGALVGQFSFTQEVTVNLAASTDTGSAHWIAANGDNIYATIVGSAEPTATPDVIGITEIYTITGGTGRFAEAQGSFTVERLANSATFFTSGSFHGTVTSPGAAH